MTTPESRPPLLRDPVLLLSLVYGIAWGLVALLARPVGDFGVETDFYGDFATYARQWADGRPSLMNGFRGPFYYLLLALADRLGLELFQVGKLLSAASAALVLWLTGDLLRRLWNGPVGISGLLLTASSLAFIDYSYRACNDLVFLALVLGSMRLLFTGSPRPARNWALSGLLAGAAWMTRYNGSILVPASLLAAPILFGRSRRTLTTAAAWLAGWFLISLPWLLFVQAEAGNPFWNKAYENIAIEVLTDDPNRAQVTGFMASVDVTSVRDIWAIDPRRLVGAMAGNVWEHLREDVRRLVGVPWAIVAGLGLLAGVASWRTRPRVAFFLFGGLSYLSLLPVFYNERFMLPLLPFWGALAGGCAWWLSQRAAARANGAARPNGAARAPGRKPGKGAGTRPGPVPLVNGLLLGLALLALVLNVQGYRLATDPRRFGGLPGEYLDLARAARAAGVTLNAGTPIAARKPHAGYYLGAPVIAVPTGSIDQLRGSGAHFLLISGAEVAVFPSLAPLWVPRAGGDLPAGLRLAAVGQFTRTNGEKTMATLYAVTDPLPYQARRPSPVETPMPPPPGLGRTDHLRLQLARWILGSGAETKPEPVFSAMSAAAREHPLVLLARAAAAIRGNDRDEAERLYRQVLAREPSNKEARLGLSSVAWLAGRGDDHRRWIAEAFALPPGEAWPSFDALKAEVDRHLRTMDAAPALGPAAAALATDRDPRWARMALAYSLQAMFQEAEARRLVEEVLRSDPSDPEARAILTSLEESARRRAER